MSDEDLGSSGKEWTYFIQSEGGGPIKIGFTTREPEQRLLQLQTGAPTKLRIVGLIPCNREKELHKKFAKHHSHGEWFNPAKQVISFIEKEASCHLADRLAMQAKLHMEASKVTVVAAGRQDVAASMFDRVFDNDDFLLESLVEYHEWDIEELDYDQEGELEDDESFTACLEEMVAVCEESGSFIEGVGVNKDACLIGFVCGLCNSHRRVNWLRELGDFADCIKSRYPEWFLFAITWSGGRRIGINLRVLATSKCDKNEHVFDLNEYFAFSDDLVRTLPTSKSSQLG